MLRLHAVLLVALVVVGQLGVVGAQCPLDECVVRPNCRTLTCADIADCSPTQLCAIKTDCALDCLNTTDCPEYPLEDPCCANLGDQPSNCAVCQATLWPIYLGGLFPITGRSDNAGLERSIVMGWACDDVNTNGTILPGYHLLCDMRDTKNNEQGALAQTFDLASRCVNSCGQFLERSVTDPCPASITLLGSGSVQLLSPIVGVVGSARSAESQIVAVMGSVIALPQLSPSSTSALLSDKRTYPYFGRTTPSDALQGSALVDLVLNEDWGWDRAFVVYTNDQYGQSILDRITSYITTLPKNRQLVLLGTRQLSAGLGKDSEEYIDASIDVILRSGARIIICATDLAIVPLLYKARLANMLNENYVWMGSDSLIQNSTLAVVYKNETVNPLFHGFLGFSPSSFVGPLGTYFIDVFNTRKDPVVFPNAVPNIYSGYTWDCVSLFAGALRQMIDEHTGPGPANFRLLNGTSPILYRKLTTVRGIPGVTGETVTLNEVGDRVGDIKLRIYNQNDLSSKLLVQVGSWSPVVGGAGVLEWDKDSVRMTAAMRNYDHPPSDVEVTTLRQEWSDPTSILVLIFAGFALIVGVINLIALSASVCIAPVMKSLLPLSLFGIAFGILFTVAFCIAAIAPASTGSCTAYIWLGVTSFQLLYGTLSVRVATICIAKLRDPSKIRFTIPWWQYVGGLGLLLAVDYLYVLIWSTVSTPTDHTFALDYNTNIVVCHSAERGWTGLWWGILLAMHALQALVTLVASVRLVYISMVFKEGHYTAYAVWSSTVVLIGSTVIVILLASFQQDPMLPTFFASMGLLSIAACVWLSIMAPKYVVVLLRRGRASMTAEMLTQWDPKQLDKIEL